jgi:hypothetical protein
MILVYLNPNFYYEWFHLMNLAFSLLGFVAVYFLSLEITKSRRLSLFSMLALVLFPGFFGQLAFNPIDMPFMVAYLWVLYLLIKYSKNDSNHWSTILLGVLIGIAQGLRQLGLTLYIVVVALDIYDYLMNRNETKWKLTRFFKERFLKYLYIFITANFFMLITWPNFAVNFFKSYIWYLFVGSNFYLWDFGLLFFGKFLENHERPWYYLPFFQLITYPYFISILFLSIIRFFKENLKNRTYFVLTSAVIINYISYFALKPVLYDGIRHFLFLVPLIVLISVKHLKDLLQLIGKKYQLTIILLIIINLFGLAYYSIREFPYQYVYFNKIGHLFGNPYKLFESDYSNTKYREGAEWIRDTYITENSKYDTSNPKEMLRVYVCDNAYAVDYFSHKKFLTVIHKEDSDLILCDYRNKLQSDYEGNSVKEFFIDGNPVLYLIRTPKEYQLL